MKIKRIEYDPYSCNFQAKFVCKTCHEEVLHKANFCQNCGSKLDVLKPSVVKLSQGELCALIYMAIESGFFKTIDKLRDFIHEKPESGGGDGFCYFEPTTNQPATN